MSTLSIKNWNKHQHYKDRSPPWIKLATDTFQDYEFSRLQDASKLLAVCIWTLAARSDDGTVPDDFDYIKRQGCLGNFVKIEHLKELITKGFLIGASTMLADCKQDARPETYREEGEREGEGETDANFVALWSSWKPFEMVKGSKASALKSYTKALKAAPPEKILNAAIAYCRQCAKLQTKTKHVTTWLNQRGWEDDYGTTGGNREGGYSGM
jgi:hypothetical protein